MRIVAVADHAGWLFDSTRAAFLATPAPLAITDV